VKQSTWIVFLSFSLVGGFLPTVSLLQGQTVASDNTPLDLGTAKVCAPSNTPPSGCSVTGSMHFNVTAGGTLGAPKVLTLGAPNQDFTLAGNTCSGNVATGSSCTVKVTFAPKFPGVRAGAVQITDGSGNVLARRLVHGVGAGPQINLDNGILTTLADSPYPNETHEGVAVDAAGNVFFGNDLPSVVYELPASGGPPVTVVATTPSTPTGVALDGAGNLYVTYELANQVVEVPPGCGDTSCQIILDGGFYEPTGIAVDFAGNVYIADTANHRVVKMRLGCVSSSCLVTIGTGWSFPFAIALDGAGNLFVSDINGGVVKVNIASGQKTTVVPDLVAYGVAVDAAGDLYMTDVFDNQILELPAGGGALITVTPTASEPWSVGLDGGGNVFVTTVLLNTAVAELHRVHVPTYTFATTPVDTTSADSPQPFRVQNTGNAALSLLGLSVDPLQNFVQVAGPGTPPDCKTGLSLQPGASCDLSVSYTPISQGPATFTAVMLNNTGNTTSAQAIPLAGIGGPTGPSVSFPAGFSYLYGDTSINLGLTFNGATIGNNVLQLTDGGLNERRSSFASTPIGLSFFQTSFDFQLTGTNTPTPDADGITFVLQENGPNAVGSPGGGLGYGLPSLTQPGTKITNSVAVKFDLHNNDGEGTSSTGFYLNGAAPTIPSINLLPSGIDLHSGHVFHVVLVYDGSALNFTITDQITKATFSTKFPANLAGLLGSPTAFAGFTGGTGAEGAVQSILNWQLTSSACCTAGMPTFPSGFSSASDLTLNGIAALSGGVLQLAHGAPFEANSAYDSTAIPVNKFTSDFDFRMNRGDGEGFTFVLQAEGLNAIGLSGGGLGYENIPHSIAIKFDRFSDAGEGSNSTGVYVGGAAPTVPSTNVLPSGINLHSGDPFHAQLSYDGANLTVSITDLAQYAVFTGSYRVNIPAAIGTPAAYAGFTASTGASAETVTILKWTMTSF
jgi:streptogramin lyase